MSQRHLDGLLPDWFDWESITEDDLERLAPLPIGLQCCSCKRYIETRYYHEDQRSGLWCNECMSRTPGIFWLRERGKGE